MSTINIKLVGASTYQTLTTAYVAGRCYSVTPETWAHLSKQLSLDYLSPMFVEASEAEAQSGVVQLVGLSSGPVLTDNRRPDRPNVPLTPLATHDLNGVALVSDEMAPSDLEVSGVVTSDGTVDTASHDLTTADLNPQATGHEGLDDADEEPTAEVKPKLVINKKSIVKV